MKPQDQFVKFSEGALVVTSISPPNPVLHSLANGSLEHGARFLVVGDSKSPSDFKLDGCDYLDIGAQRGLPYQYAAACPLGSYARKNIGYLHAIAGGAKFIVETDDDNFPKSEFWNARNIQSDADRVTGKGWINVYSLFSDSFIYPRGFPLEQARCMSDHSMHERILTEQTAICPIQQGLADGDPDVDAVYRMLFPLPFHFQVKQPIRLGENQWCPFNSQNTTFFPQAYPLLYLPAHCSFRMTDIWRGFVAQRILWACGWELLFHAATVYQERNEHNLLRDFEDEIPGYKNNAKIAATLAALPLQAGIEAIPENMIACYGALIRSGWVGEGEATLLASWLHDIQQF